LISGYGIIKWIAGYGGSPLFAGSLQSGVDQQAYARRLQSVFREPSYFAAYVVPIYLGSLYDYFINENKIIEFKYNYAYGLSLLVITFAMVLNASLSAVGVIILG
jgi:hypothetical protein